MVEIIAVIPARSGSKSVIKKNIRIFNGMPLMAHSILFAKKSKMINRIIVSTDSEEYATIAKQFGAEVPFIRPKEISGDLSTDLEVFKHALQWLKDNEGYCPDICVHLRPTHPVRDIKDLEQMINEIITDEKIDSIRSISPTKDTPYKMWFKNEDEFIHPVIDTDILDAYNEPRQKLPQTFIQNASIDVIRSKTIIEKNSMTGSIIKGHLINYNVDIDTENDFIYAEQYSMLENIREKKFTFCFDIDGIIATKTINNDYQNSEPILRNIILINKLYEMGHKIVIFTARGYVTKKDWREVTKQQLQEWKVKYHELLFEKPNADFYIDDKFIDASTVMEFLK